MIAFPVYRAVIPEVIIFCSLLRYQHSRHLSEILNAEESLQIVLAHLKKIDHKFLSYKSQVNETVRSYTVSRFS